MKKIPAAILMIFMASMANAQNLKTSAVPASAKDACTKMFETKSKVSWEKENGNFEANWGGKSNEDSSAQFSETGKFVQLEIAISVNALPASVINYVKKNYQNAKINEAGKISNDANIVSYEAEVKGKDLIFDSNGNFLKID